MKKMNRVESQEGKESQEISTGLEPMRRSGPASLAAALHQGVLIAAALYVCCRSCELRFPGDEQVGLRSLLIFSVALMHVYLERENEAGRVLEGRREKKRKGSEAIFLPTSCFLSRAARDNNGRILDAGGID